MLRAGLKYICLVVAFMALPFYYLVIQSWPVSIEDNSFIAKYESNRASVVHGREARDFAQGQVVVYEEPGQSPGTCQLSRVIALEGNHVVIGYPPRDKPELTKVSFGTPLVNGVEYEHKGIYKSADSLREIIVPRDHVFLLGDYRQKSRGSDSITHGPIPLRLVRGWVKVGEE